jgi:pheromone shutdown protein TraB
MFQKCEEKMEKELDVLKLMKLGRQVKLLAQVMLSQRQKMLLKF